MFTTTAHELLLLLNTHLPGRWPVEPAPPLGMPGNPSEEPSTFSSETKWKDICVRTTTSLSLSLFVDINLRRLWPLTVPPLPHDINDLKDRIPRAGATTERQMLQSVEQEI
jgi:hypothetical protein